MDHSDTHSEENRPWPRAKLEELGRLLVELGLLSSARAWSDALGDRNAGDPADILRSVAATFPPDGNASPVAAGSGPREGGFTEFQIRRIIEGRAHSLRIGNYLILDELGRGGMGHVFRARDVVLGHLVALKVLVAKGDATERQVALDRFKREARLLANLRHPNLTSLYSASFEGDVAYIAMELIAGDTLTRYVQRHVQAGTPIPLDWTLDGMQAIAGALALAHARGCIHRDVKPDNVMVAQGQLKLVDLGIASLRRTAGSTLRAHDRTLTRPGELIGSPPYMPPEQWAGDQIDERADVYSLGATLYFALTGSSPYEAADTFGMYLAHMQRPIPRVRDKRTDIPRQVDELIARMLAKRPEERIGTMDEVVEALSRIRTPATREPRRVLIGLGAALLVGLLALGWVIRGLTSPTSSASSSGSSPPSRSPSAAWLAEHFSDNRLVWGSSAALLDYVEGLAAEPEVVPGLIEEESRRRWRGLVEEALDRIQQAHSDTWESPASLRRVVERSMDLAAIRDTQSLAALEEACRRATALRRETRAWLGRGWDQWPGLLARSLPMRVPRDVLLKQVVETTGFLFPFQLKVPIDRKNDWELVARQQLYRWVLGQGTTPADRADSVGLEFRFRPKHKNLLRKIKIERDQIEIPPEEGILEIKVSSERDTFLTMVVLREEAEDYLRVYQRPVNKSQKILQEILEPMDARPKAARIHFLLTDEPVLKYLEDGVREKAIQGTHDDLAKPFLQLQIEAMARADRVRNPGLTLLAHRLVWRGESVAFLRAAPNIRAARTIDVKVQ